MMKKTTALLLCLVLTLGLLAGCGTATGRDEVETETATMAAQPTVAASAEEPTTADVSNEIIVITAGALAEHENGWFHKEETKEDGLFFKLQANDLPVDETWSVRYVSTSTDCVKLIRYGEYHTIDARVLKYSDNEYYLCLDAWLTGDLSPLQAGDVIMLQGVFMHPNGKYEPAIRFDTTYITIEAEEKITISTTAPET